MKPHRSARRFGPAVAPMARNWGGCLPAAVCATRTCRPALSDSTAIPSGVVTTSES